MSSGPRSLLIWTVLILVLAATVIGVRLIWQYGRNTAHWWGTSDSTKVLLADPMAAPDLLGLRLISHEQTQHVGLTDKAGPAYVINTFDTGDADAAEIQRQLLEFAQARGWTPTPDTSTAEYLNASRRADDCTSLAVSIEQVDPSESAADRLGTVRVSLHFGGTIIRPGDDHECSSEGDR